MKELEFVIEAEVYSFTNKSLNNVGLQILSSGSRKQAAKGYLFFFYLVRVDAPQALKRMLFHVP